MPGRFDSGVYGASDDRGRIAEMLPAVEEAPSRAPGDAWVADRLEG